VVHYGIIDSVDDQIEQVKGISYSMKDFLGENSPIYQKMAEKKPGNDFYYCVIYLAPGDYHGYHSPATWSITERRHFPGHLFPVNKRSVNFIKGVLAFNERVTLFGEWEHGIFSYTAVGAYNVGSMKIGFDPELITNQPSQNVDSPFEIKNYVNPIKSDCGENIGFFNLGSTVVLIFEAPKLLFMRYRGEQVQLGESLAVKLTPELAEEHAKRLQRRQKQIDDEMIKYYEEILKEDEAQKAYIIRTEQRKQAAEKHAERFREMQKEWYGVDEETAKALQERKKNLRERTEAR